MDPYDQIKAEAGLAAALQAYFDAWPSGTQTLAIVARKVGDEVLWTREGPPFVWERLGAALLAAAHRGKTEWEMHQEVDNVFRQYSGEEEEIVQAGAELALEAGIEEVIARRFPSPKLPPICFSAD